MIEFRELREDEIEVRVAQVSRYGVNLLLYKTARTDADILDEKVGNENWQCRFYEEKGTLFCAIGINVKHIIGDATWVWKSDAGEPSSMSAQKGEASDAFKRAGFKWGIGRALYTSPRIYVREKVYQGPEVVQMCQIEQGKNGKPVCYDAFSVEKIRYENGEITGLSIMNDTLKRRCFVYVKQGEGNS